MSQNLTLHVRGELSPTWCASLVTMALITTMTIIGNGAVIAALSRLRRAPSHYPLANLAVADLLLGMFVLPVAAARELFVFRLNWAICSCWNTLDVLCCTASILSLCVLGWERWSGITAPLSRARRLDHSRLYAALVWPVAAAVALPTGLVPSERQNRDAMTMACTVNTNVGLRWNSGRSCCLLLSATTTSLIFIYHRAFKATKVPEAIGRDVTTPRIHRYIFSCQRDRWYVFFSAFLSFYLPAIIMVTLYARILLALSALPQIRSHRGCTPTKNGINKYSEPKSASPTQVSIKSLKNAIFSSPKGCHLNAPTNSTTKQSSSNPTKGFLSKQHRATRTIVMLMSLFLLCWTPFFIMLPIDSLCECTKDRIWWWCTWLGYGNSSLNPLVYAAASPSVRRALTSSTKTHSTART